jgi:fumarate reductase iron-sulfur subunit
MTLYIALNKIREEHDAGLQFDFACRSAICGSCAMMVNGRPALACRTLTTDLPEKIQLYPLPVFKLIGDLSVDTGTWFRAMAERTEAWVHSQIEFDTDAVEERMSDDVAAAIYENDRCIECGCCVAACGAANMDDAFLAGAGLNRIKRFARSLQLSATQTFGCGIDLSRYGHYVFSGREGSRFTVRTK